jgi:C-terminal processing protease CtpA/Prc
MDSAFDVAFKQLKHCTTEADFIRTLDRTVSYLGCMHTGVGPSKKYLTEFYRDIRYFPLELKILGEKAYILKNGSEVDELSPGLEVTHVNGWSIDSLKNWIYIHDSADGYTTNWSIAARGPHLGWFMAAYIGKVDTYRVRYIKDDSAIEVELKALPRDTINSNMERRHGKPVTQVPFIRLTFREDLSTAILHVDRFDNWKIGDQKYEFLEVLEPTMKKIVDSGVRNLIIDVGDKGGGNEYFGLKIISHLIDTPYVGYKRIEFTNKKFKSMKYSNTTWLEYLYYRSKLKFKEQPDGTYTIRYPALDAMTPSQIQFKGNVYVITSGMTASATSDFAAQLHGLRRATFVGEETGGSYVGNTSNFEFAIKLPNTKAKLYVPLARYITNVDQNLFFGRGLKPDYEVVPTISDILKGIDTQLEFTLDLIRRNQ